MNDLINNRTIDEVNILIQKYAGVLELIKQQEEIPYLAIVIDVGVKYVKEKHNDLNIDWKAWTIVYLKNQYLNGQIKKEENISNLIENFIKNYYYNYNEHINNLGIYLSDFDRDYAFVCNYFQKEKGGN